MPLGRHIARVAVAAAVVIPAILVLSRGWDGSASLRGRLMARRDIARGHYELLGYGMPTPKRSEYARCLQERYGMNYRRVADCIVSKQLLSYVDSYNSTMIAAARRRFGHDVVRGCWDSANSRTSMEEWAPCRYYGEILRDSKGQPVRFTSDEMKQRATGKVDVSKQVKQWDIKATAIVDVLIGPQGEVICSKGLAGHPIVVGSVKAALESWRFLPALAGGKPVAYLGRLEFSLCNINCGAEGTRVEAPGFSPVTWETREDAALAAVAGAKAQ